MLITGNECKYNGCVNCPNTLNTNLKFDLVTKEIKCEDCNEYKDYMYQQSLIQCPTCFEKTTEDRLVSVDKCLYACPKCGSIRYIKDIESEKGKTYPKPYMSIVERPM